MGYQYRLHNSSSAARLTSPRRRTRMTNVQCVVGKSGLGADCSGEILLSASGEVIETTKRKWIYSAKQLNSNQTTRSYCKTECDNPSIIPVQTTNTAVVGGN